MKIIVSTESFPKIIKKAIDNESESFDVIGKEGKIIFYGIKKIETYIHPIVGDVECNYSNRFNTRQWYRVCEFLKLLQEQPIVIEFDNYNDDHADIKLTQFEASF